MTSMKQIVIRAALLAGAAALVGFVFNLVRPAGIEIGRSVVEAKTDAVEQLREEALRKGPRGPAPAHNSGPPGPVPPIAAAGLVDPAPAAADRAAGTSERLEFRLEPQDLFDLYQSGGVYILDARQDVYYAQGHIPGARMLPPEEYDERIFDISAELPVDTPIVVYCEGGDCTSSLEVARRLIEDGWANVHLFEGGYPEWEAAGYPVTKGMEP